MPIRSATLASRLFGNILHQKRRLLLPGLTEHIVDIIPYKCNDSLHYATIGILTPTAVSVTKPYRLEPAVGVEPTVLYSALPRRCNRPLMQRWPSKMRDGTDRGGDCWACCYAKGAWLGPDPASYSGSPRPTSRPALRFLPFREGLSPHGIAARGPYSTCGLYSPPRSDFGVFVGLIPARYARDGRRTTH